jgi:hypothetical protein
MRSAASAQKGNWWRGSHRLDVENFGVSTLAVGSHGEGCASMGFLRTRSALCAIGLGIGFSAAAGTVSGILTVTGLAAHTPFTVTFYKDDGSEAAHLDLVQSGFYSVDLPPGHYKVQCTSPSKAGGNAAQYLFALQAPVARNLTLSCG